MNENEIVLTAGFLGCTEERAFKGGDGTNIPIFSVSFVLNGRPVRFNVSGTDAVKKLFPVCSSLKYGDFVNLIMKPFVKEEKLVLKMQDVVLA
jgi:hypothetical protein